jgi:hypothetical protein
VGAVFCTFLAFPHIDIKSTVAAFFFFIFQALQLISAICITSLQPNKSINKCITFLFTFSLNWIEHAFPRYKRGKGSDAYLLSCLGLPLLAAAATAWAPCPLLCAGCVGAGLDGGLLETAGGGWERGAS